MKYKYGKPRQSITTSVPMTAACRDRLPMVNVRESTAHTDPDTAGLVLFGAKRVSHCTVVSHVALAFTVG